MNDLLEFLQSWYLEQCDGDWEHEFGIEISNLDNPGWIVTVDLTRTNIESAHFTEVRVERSETDWYRCRVKDSVFDCVGGANNLKEILEQFRSFATNSSK